MGFKKSAATATWVTGIISVGSICIIGIFNFLYYAFRNDMEWTIPVVVIGIIWLIVYGLTFYSEGDDDETTNQ